MSYIVFCESVVHALAVEVIRHGSKCHVRSGLRHGVDLNCVQREVLALVNH